LALWAELRRLSEGGAAVEISRKKKAINPDEESSSSSESGDSASDGNDLDSTKESDRPIAGETIEFPPRGGRQTAIKAWTPFSWLFSYRNQRTKVRKGSLVRIGGQKRAVEVAQVGEWCKSQKSKARNRFRNDAIVWIATSKKFMVVPFNKFDVAPDPTAIPAHGRGGFVLASAHLVCLPLRSFASRCALLPDLAIYQSISPLSCCRKWTEKALAKFIASLDQQPPNGRKRKPAAAAASTASR
jgi:hypothetical protein